MFTNLLFLNSLCFQSMLALASEAESWAITVPLPGVAIQCDSVCVLAIAALDLDNLVLHRLRLVKLLPVDADDPVISDQIGGFGLAVQDGEIFRHPGQPLNHNTLQQGDRSATMLGIRCQIIVHMLSVNFHLNWGAHFWKLHLLFLHHVCMITQVEVMSTTFLHVSAWL